jgi:hypothetical protein
MDIPNRDDHPPQPSDRLHLLLAERGSAILPEAGNADGRVTLTDAMLGVAALAVCFALARASLALGLGALVVVLPALLRTHVVMVRGRDLGSPTNAGAWLWAFVSSTIRIGLILGLVLVIHVAGVTVGGYFGSRFAEFYVANTGGPWTSFGSRWLMHGDSYGAVVGFLTLAIPLTLLALAYLVPRLLSVRDPI